MVGAAILLVVATVLAAMTLQDRSAADAETQARKAAERVAVASVELNSQTLEADLDRVLALATGTFERQLREQRPAFEQTIGDAEIEVEAAVRASGIAGRDGDDVVVLVALSSTVTNPETPEGGDSRAYRMKITMTQTDDRWLAEKLELVG